MERLTERKENGRAYILGCPDFEIQKIFALIIQTVVDKCADYEDTGLEPQEITRIVNEYGRGHTLRTHAAERLELIREIPTDRLRKLVEADRDGRCHIGRCVECEHYEGLAVCELLGDCGGTDWICGWFEPKKDAEAALKGEQDGQ